MLILSLLRKHDNSLILKRKQASARRMCATKRYSIWIDPIKKCTSNGMWRIIDDSAYGCIRRGYCFVAEFSAAKRELVRATPLQLAQNWADSTWHKMSWVRLDAISTPVRLTVARSRPRFEGISIWHPPLVNGRFLWYHASCNRQHHVPLFVFLQP